MGRVDFTTKRIHVVEQVTRASHGYMVAGPPKSRAGSRSLSAPDVLLTLISRHMNRLGLEPNDGDALLFTDRDGDLLDYSNWRQRVWVPACKASGLAGLVFHDLRRVNATVLVAEGVDLKTAQTRLGHSDPRLTLAIYAQATTAADQDAAERVARHLLAGTSDEPTDRIVAAECAMNVRWNEDEAVELAEIIPLTRGNGSREGGIRTRDLSVPNAAR